MIQGLDHITIVVSDLEHSGKFYSELLDFKETGRAHLEGEWIDSILQMKGVKADVVYLLPPDGKLRLELLCFRSPKGALIDHNAFPNTVGLRHMAFQVEDMDSAVKRLKAAGVRLFSGPVTLPQDVESGAAKKKTLCYFLDPDETLLELAEYR
jgi:catechol 2,3-dioxygenase-like lactoylglutathione lyase family enzyme